MGIKFERKKTLSCALGCLIIFLFIGIVFRGEIRIFSDTWDYICPVQFTEVLTVPGALLQGKIPAQSKALNVPRAPLRGKIPAQTNCNACSGFSDLFREFVECDTALLCDCPSETPVN